jgi:uncharacterized protein with ATP-grasp and redox domains
MKPYTECAPCILKWVYERVADSASESQRFTILQKIMHVLSGHFEPSVNMGALCNMTVGAVQEFVLASSGFYGDLRRRSNEAAAELMEQAEEFIEKGGTPPERFERACGLASVANVAPIGAPSAPFKFPQVEEIIRGGAPLPSPVGDIYDAASKAHRVFYIADNAGEIGFDSLLIALLKKMGSKVTLVVKEEPFFDDATLEDTRYFGLEKMADAVHSVRGVFVPEEGNPELNLIFKDSDLIISKGTGNFEALKGYPGKKRFLYLLKAKCHPVSHETSTPEGEFIVRLEG